MSYIGTRISEDGREMVASSNNLILYVRSDQKAIRRCKSFFKDDSFVVYKYPDQDRYKKEAYKEIFRQTKV